VQKRAENNLSLRIEKVLSVQEEEGLAEVLKEVKSSSIIRRRQVVKDQEIRELEL
jgi:hypothetical protein